MIVELEIGEYLTKHDSTFGGFQDSTYDACNLFYQDFFENHLLKNVPCIVKNISATWECSEKWIKNNDINYEFLIQTYGNLEASVANCRKILDYAQRSSTMKVSNFLNYMQNNQKDDILYLKDLHLKKLRPDDNFYTVPKIFTSDWLNEYAHDKNEDDFKFVYIGPKGSWTPIHADVYNSYSWSVNVIGRKKWILFPPGEEKKLKDDKNQLPLLFDPVKNDDVTHYVIIQEQGDAIFVPSGWHHQVENQLNTISINHNWNNGCNINYMWDMLNETLIDVEKELVEFENSSEYTSECQLMLNALYGANYESFISFISYIARKRFTQLIGEENPSDEVCLGTNHVLFDLKMILNIMEKILTHPNCNNGRLIINNDFLSLNKQIINVLQNK